MYVCMYVCMYEFMYEYTGLCIEFKIPTNNYQISEAEREMKRRYRQNNYRFLISNSEISVLVTLRSVQPPK